MVGLSLTLNILQWYKLFSSSHSQVSSGESALLDVRGECECGAIARSILHWSQGADNRAPHSSSSSTVICCLLHKQPAVTVRKAKSHWACWLQATPKCSLSSLVLATEVRRVWRALCRSCLYRCTKQSCMLINWIGAIKCLDEESDGTLFTSASAVVFELDRSETKAKFIDFAACQAQGAS